MPCFREPWILQYIEKFANDEVSSDKTKNSARWARQTISSLLT